MSTHSPYILTSINNLLLASQLIKQDKNLKEKVGEIIRDDFLLDVSHLEAYLISDGAAKSIIDTETGLINADEIDGVSVSLAQEFDKLLDLASNDRQQI